MTKVLVTGGAGFIGANFVRLLNEKHSDWEMVVVDLLTYAGNIANLDKFMDNDNFTFIKADICDAAKMDEVMVGIDYVINFAAESHVDRSILSAADFIRTNIEGTRVLLDASMKHNIKKFLQVSTDEVYGSLGAEGFFREDTPLSPNSPYSASKASADMLVSAYHHTFGAPVLITRCSNNYGPFQFPEKLIPLFVTNLTEDKKVPVYGDGKQVRDWIYVDDHCEAVLAVLEKGEFGQVYNIGGGNELFNIDLTKMIIEQLGKDESLIEYVTDRPGHDRRYAIDCKKINNELGWSPKMDFKKGLKKTIQWYLDNEPWWRAIKSGQYLEYYNNQYGDRLKS